MLDIFIPSLHLAFEYHGWCEGWLTGMAPSCFRDMESSPLPEVLAEGLPAGVRLDGELWMRKGTFERLKSVFYSSGRNATESAWKNEVKFVLFDMLDPKLLYEQRIEALRRLNLLPFISVVEVEECCGNEHLNEPSMIWQSCCNLFMQ